MNKKLILVAATSSLWACGTPSFQDPNSSSSSVNSSSQSSVSSSHSSVSSSSSSDYSSSSSTSQSSSSSPDGILFEDNFDSYTIGQFPGAPWKTRIAFDTSSTDTSRVSVVGDSYSGSGAVKVSSPGPFNPAFIFLDFAPQVQSEDHLYIRMFLNASAGLGGDGGHAHIIELSKDGQNGIRFGEANGSIGVNTVDGGDPLAPQPNQADEDLNANQWYCMEVLLDKRPAYDELVTWVDGSEVLRISNDQGQWGQIWTNNGPNPDWLENAFNDQIQFGWYAFSGVRGNTILFDDIVISRNRVGCDYLSYSVGGDGVQY